MAEQQVISITTEYIKLEALLKLANLVVLVTRSLASASRIASVLDIVPDERSGAQAVIPSETEAVSFEDVGIAYPGSGKESQH